MNVRPLVAVAAAIALSAACGGGSSGPKTPTGPEASSSASTASSTPATASAAESASAAPSASVAAKKEWKAMSRDEKLELMKTAVMPKMSALFQGYDAAKYKDFKCVACHGPGAKEGKFDMPNPGLPKLNPKDGFKKHKDKNAKMLTFMMTQVVPEMAALLGEKPYNPETKSGFGCGDCHVMEK